MDEKVIESNKRIALIPAYEPDEKMLEVAKELKDNSFKVVIVNDGSGVDKDAIFTEAKSFATVISHEVNKGKGAAIKTGLRYITENCFAPFTVVTVDADGQHKVVDAIRVCERAERQKGSLILGSRKMEGKIPLRSRLGNTITRFVYRLSSGAKVYDTQTGLRAFSDSLISELVDIPGSRYEYEMNMLMTFAKENRPIEEVWIETVYLDEKNSSSHFDTVKDSFRIYKEIIKFSGSSLIGFIIDYIMYCLLIATSGKIVLSNVLARLVSASVNYSLNRTLVFKSNAPVARSAMQYGALAVFILVCNTILLNTLVGLGVGIYAAKVLTEIIMFTFSWTVQHKIIFGNKRDNENRKKIINGQQSVVNQKI